MSQELIESTELKVMTVDEAQRAHYKQTLAAIDKEGPAILAGIKNKAGVDRASAWRLRLRDFIKSVESGSLGIASAWLHRRKKEIDAEINFYVDPCEKMFKEAKVKMDRWYLEESERVRIANEKAMAKDVAKAEVKQQQKVQTLMDLGKPKAAMIAAQKPLAVVPTMLAMPKIKNAAWSKDYFIQINDMGALLAHIAKNPKYHDMIDKETLVSKLKALATTLDGNMAEFAKHGVQCFVTPTSATVGGRK